MKTERCREWRESLGAYALGHLSRRGAGRAWRLTSRAVPSCRAELDSLAAVARLLPLADPDRFRRRARRRPRRAGRGGDRPPSGAAPAGGGCGFGLALSGRPRRSRRLCWRSSSSPAASDVRARPSTSPSVAAAGHEDRREAGAARVRHRDPRLRQGRPLRRPLPRLPARAATAPVSPPAPSATAGETTRRRSSARRSTSPAPAQSAYA